MQPPEIILDKKIPGINSAKSSAAPSPVTVQKEEKDVKVETDKNAASSEVNGVSAEKNEAVTEKTEADPEKKDDEKQAEKMETNEEKKSDDVKEVYLNYKTRYIYDLGLI